MLPRNEIDALLTTITDAADLGAEGDAHLGSEALLAGLRRAAEMRDPGQELERRWQTALDRFAERWRIARA